jgi:selenocysteine lyase/cysteine desulfurase
MMSIRDRFPIFREKVYLNSCSQGALSTDVEAAYAAYLNDWREKGSPWEYWVECMEAVRGAFAGLLNAHSDEIAVTSSVSAGVNALASALDFTGERHKIVVSDFDFPTVNQIWHAQERRGAEVVHVPAAGHLVPVEHFAAAIDERTLLVSITHVCYRNGSRLDVPAIVDLAHSQGARVLLDSYQALGTFPMATQAFDVDFLVGGTLKYLLGSPGLAFLYAREELIPDLHPTCIGWFSQADIFAMDLYANTPSPTARRFEESIPAVPSLYAGLAGLELIQSIGLGTIEVHIGELTDAIKLGARERGFALGMPTDPSQHGALITLRSHDVGRLVACLAADGIITSSRDDNLRVSPHIYNNLSDVERLMSCLEKHCRLLE